MTNRYLSRNGGALTDTVPATASTGAATAGQIVALGATGAISPTMLTGGAVWPVLDVSYGPGTGQIITTAFTTVALSTVNTDTISGYNSSTFKYTIGVTGTYLIVSKLRFGDGSTSNVSYGQGVDTSNADSPSFGWFQTYPTALGGQIRNGSINTRIARFTAGTVINMFAYVDNSGITVDEAALNVVLMSAG